MPTATTPTAADLDDLEARAPGLAASVARRVGSAPQGCVVRGGFLPHAWRVLRLSGLAYLLPLRRVGRACC